MLYMQHTLLKKFQELIEEAPKDTGFYQVLTQLNTLYGLWSLQKHTATLYCGMGPKNLKYNF